ncbi:MAG TPA: RraA family protein [Chloroflexota bacterium]|nr:RraA family protein [Chloroflexota bacterium]
MPLLDATQIDALRAIDSPTIANAIESFGLRPRREGFVGQDIRCIYPDLPPTVGYAVTCTVDSTTEGRVGIGFNRLYALLALAPKPAIVVMQDVGPHPQRSCHAGEIMSSVMKRLGAVGILTNGGLRDVHQIRALQDFQLFCSGLVVSHGNPICVSVGEPVTISGLAIESGDLLHGDVNGLVLIPADCAQEVLAASQQVLARETELLQYINSPEFRLSDEGEFMH